MLRRAGFPSVGRMSDAARQTSRDRAMTIVRGYVHQDPVTVGEALEGADAGGATVFWSRNVLISRRA